MTENLHDFLKYISLGIAKDKHYIMKAQKIPIEIQVDVAQRL